MSRVEQQQRHAPDRGLPDARHEPLVAGHGDLDEHLLARRVDQQLQRQALGVEHRVGLQLPAVQRQRLPEVARPVQQPDADQREPEVRGRLEVVAREHAEAARVVGQHLGDAELHREVADRRGQGRVVLALTLVPARLREVLGEVVGELADGHDGLGVGGQLGDLGHGDFPEQPHGIVARALPRLRVERGEQVQCRRVPAPPQVGGQRLQRRERGRQLRPDGETAKGSHGGKGR